MIRQVPLCNRQIGSDPLKMEYLVRVEWLDAVPENEAVKEVGFFGNQNTVCHPASPKWRHTVDRLKTIFKKWDNAGWYCWPFSK